MKRKPLKRPDAETVRIRAKEYPDIPIDYISRGLVSFHHRAALSPGEQYELIKLFNTYPHLPFKDIYELFGTEKASYASCYSVFLRIANCDVIDTVEKREKKKTKAVLNLKARADETRVREVERQEKKQEANMALADRFESFVVKGMEALNSRDLSREPTDRLMRAVAVATDRMRLLRDEATQKIVNTTHTLVEHVAYVESLPYEEQMKLANVEDAVLVEDMRATAEGVDVNGE